MTSLILFISGSAWNFSVFVLFHLARRGAARNNVMDNIFPKVQDYVNHFYCGILLQTPSKLVFFKINNIIVGFGRYFFSRFMGSYLFPWSGYHE